MPIYEREKNYISLLAEREYTISELSKILFVSEPTVRRDVLSMKKDELVECVRGRVRLKTNSPDKRIPLFVRDFRNNEQKQKIAEKAAKKAEKQARKKVKVKALPAETELAAADELKTE